MLADGRLHLTAIAKLAPHLTPDNRDAVLARATHCSKRQVEELVAELAPRPDAPALVRKLPERPPAAPAPDTRAGGPTGPTTSLRPHLDPIAGPSLEPRPDAAGLQLEGGHPVGSSEPIPGRDQATPSDPELGPDAVGQAGVALAVAPPASVRPLAPGRYRVQFTASAQLRDKLERLQALLRSSGPGPDLAAVIEDAVTEKLERLEARRFGLTRAHRKSLAQVPPKAPRTSLTPAPTKPGSRHVPAAVRRAVYERDGGRCRFVDEQGRRCTARHGLEFHHRHPVAMGGDHSPQSVALVCRAHNLHLAEVDYGRAVMARHRRTSTV
jgi:5-methylcytosine-specific restriction endonuclease McrA